MKIISENFGKIRPDSIDDYIDAGGFSAIEKVLKTMDPTLVINEVKKSNLLGRSGSGFPTGLKWEMTKNMRGDKYLVCNADESEPGTFKDRLILNSDPLKVIEGIMIASYAVGSVKNFIYIRGEYENEFNHLKTVMLNLKNSQYLSNLKQKYEFDFDLEIRSGAGAYVCGEETALIESLEGHRGTPRVRPPYPSQSGYKNHPTLLSNVETFANIPFIINNGADAYRKIGAPGSAGTRLVSLSGNVLNAGVYEVTLGTSLNEIINNIGGGMSSGKLKMIQLGGSSGFCLPPESISLNLDFNELKSHKIGMGCGSILVVNDSNCVIDFVKCSLEFFIDESCGRCTPCREGLRQLYKIYDKISEGYGTADDLKHIGDLASTISSSSNCGLGQTSVTCVTTTLNYFMDEYLDHINGVCRSNKCIMTKKEAAI